MKKKLLVLVSIVFSVLISNAQTITKPYDYPIKRGTVEWNGIKDYRSLRKVCEIPIDVVNHMTTEALLESILDYPLLGDAFVFATFQKGIDNLKINFNAFETLVNRPDVGKALFKKYKRVAAHKIDNEPLLAKGEHSVKLSFIELMLGQSFTDNTAAKHESMSVVKTLIDSYNEKNDNVETYGTMSLSTCAWALNKILIRNNANAEFLVKNKFVEEGNIFSQETLNEILSKAKKYHENLSK